MTRSLPLLLLALVAVSCDNTINPLTDDAATVFAVHGYLDTAAETQFVRIQPLSPSAVAHSDFEGVEVRSQELGTGGFVTWNADPALEPGDGTRLYRASLVPDPGRAYRMEVLRQGAVATIASVTVPVVPALELGAFNADSLFAVQRLLVGASELPPHTLTLEYTVVAPGSDEERRFSIARGTGGEPSMGRWAIDLFLSRDRATVLLGLGLPPEERNARLVGLTVLVEVLSEGWKETSPQHGQGFFGAVGRYRIPLRLSPETVGVAGFQDGQPAGSAP